MQQCQNLITRKLKYIVIGNMEEIRDNLFCTLIYITEAEMKLLTVCKLKCYNAIKG
jgi:Na+/H+ antiporter NhaB